VDENDDGPLGWLFGKKKKGKKGDKGEGKGET